MQSEQRADPPLTVSLNIIAKNKDSQAESISTQFILKEGEFVNWLNFTIAVGNEIPSRNVVLKIYKTQTPETSTTFITSSYEFILMRMHNEIKITHDGLPAYVFDDLNCNYTVEIYRRVTEMQNNLLVRDIEVGKSFNVLVLYDGVPKIYPLVKSLAPIFTTCSDRASVTFCMNGNDLNVKLSELRHNRIVSHENPDKIINSKNYMYFKINSPEDDGASVQKELSYVEAFSSKLKGSGPIEVERLFNRIIDDKIETLNSLNVFYAPIINVCQSSGSGKSRLANEVMKKLPSAYVVLRKDRQAYPFASQLSDMVMLGDIDFSKYNENAIVTYYAILINEILADYLDLLESEFRRLFKNDDIESGERPCKRSKEDYNLINEGENSIKDEKNSIKEGENSIKDEKNSINYENSSINDENNSINEKNKSIKPEFTEKFLNQTSKLFIEGKFAPRYTNFYFLITEISNSKYRMNRITNRVEFQTANLTYSNLIPEDSASRNQLTSDLTSMNLPTGSATNLASSTLSPLQRACKNNIESILKFFAAKTGTRPSLFVFILDEASLLTERKGTNGKNLFRLFRRALNGFFMKQNFIVLTLGTKSDILDLNPAFSSDSFRANAPIKLLPPFIVSRNWDVLFDKNDLKHNRIGYDSLQCGRLVLFHASLGRPLFSSCTLPNIPILAFMKMTNSSLESGESFLACWMMRLGLTVHPYHVVCKHLSKSLMARLLYLSDNLFNMRVDYPSEPVLAFAAREIVHGTRIDSNMIGSRLPLLIYYEKLEYYIHARAIDYGRMSEIIYGDVLLQAVFRSDRIQMKTWLFVDGLPSICRKNHFLLHDDQAPTELLADDDETISSTFENFDTTVTLNSFAKSMFGSELENFIPSILKSSLLNASHFVQMSPKFPFEKFPQTFGNTTCQGEQNFTKGPVADSRFENESNPCDMITQGTLETGIMRSNAFMAPPSYFGLDMFIPICLDPDLVAGKLPENSPIVVPFGTKARLADQNTEYSIRRIPPTYSYIGCQVKKSANYGNVRKLVSNCAISNHLVRCAVHQNCSQDCEYRLRSEVCLKHRKTSSDENCPFRPRNIPCKLHQNCTFERNCCRKHSNCDDENCSIRIPDQTYSQLIGNGLAFLHIMTPESFSQRPSDMCIVEIRDETLWKYRDNLTSESSEFLTSPELQAARDLFKMLCPESIVDIFSTCNNKKTLNFNSFDECRFIPDIYVSKTLGEFLKVHFMAKKHDETGFIERITVIESRGLQVFRNFFPENVAEIANRIIYNEVSIFDQIGDRNDVQNLIQNVVYCNNDSSIPIANNYLRHCYGEPEIPDPMATSKTK